MFNEDLKRRYIEYKHSITEINEFFLSNLFKKTEPFEEKLNKDVSCFTVNEIEDMFKTISYSSIYTLDLSKSSLSLYTDWCIAQYYVPDKQNHFKEIVWQDLPRFLNVNIAKKKVVTRECVLDWCEQMPNPMDAFIILAMFEGIDGRYHNEFIHLYGSDIDIEKRMIKVIKRGYVSASLKLCELGLQAAGTSVYYSVNENSEEYKLEKSDKVVKDFINVKYADDELKAGRRIYSKLKRALNYVDAGYLTPKDLQNSGIVDFINTRSNELGITNMEYLNQRGTKREIEERFNINGVKLYSIKLMV